MNSVVGAVFEIFEVVNWVFDPAFLEQRRPQVVILAENNEDFLAFVQLVLLLKPLDGLSRPLINLLLAQVLRLFALVDKLEYFLIFLLQVRVAGQATSNLACICLSRLEAFLENHLESVLPVLEITEQLCLLDLVRQHVGVDHEVSQTPLGLLELHVAQLCKHVVAELLVLEQTVHVVGFHK